MKLQLSATLLAVAACAMTVAAAHAQSSAINISPDDSPTESASRAHRIEGLWDEQVTVRDCTSGAVLMVTRGTNLFARSGALTAVNNAPPMILGLALGQWWHESRGYYFGAKMRLNRFNPDGSFVGIREIEREITLDNAADKLTGNLTARDYDTDDNLLHTTCGSEAGTRIESP